MVKKSPEKRIQCARGVSAARGGVLYSTFSTNYRESGKLREVNSNPSGFGQKFRTKIEKGT
jgi:hypothetical protein